MKKTIYIILITLLFVASLSTMVSCTPYKVPMPLVDDYIETYTLTVDDLNLPPIAKSDMGLFCYNVKTDRFENCDGKTTFDPSKPTVVYTHGMGSGHLSIFLDDELSDLGINPNSEPFWIDAGYNFLAFDWGPYSDELDPWQIQTKIWGTNGQGDMRYRVKDVLYTDSKEYGDYCVTEMYAVYLLNFLRSVNYEGEIRLMGHSMGAMLTCAVGGYLTYLGTQNMIAKQYVPSRVLLYDTFISNGRDETYCKWLDTDFTKYGSAKALYLSSMLMAENGVAVEYMHTGYADAGRIAFDMSEDPNDATYLKFWGSTFMLDYRSEYMDDKYATSAEKISGKHCIGMGIYSAMLAEDYIMEDNGLFGFSPRTPTSVVMARNGDLVQMEENNTIDISDDIQFSDSTKLGRIAGYVFEDYNKNGFIDESMKYRIEGILVILYKDGKKVDETTTSYGGFYLFEDVDIGDGYTVKFDTPYPLTKLGGAVSGDYYYLMDNNMTSTTSESFSISSSQMKILNLGLID